MDFKIITPAIYWALIILWTFVFVFYLKKLFGKNTTDKFFRLLLLILAIDAFRTLFESMYFGAWYTSLTEIIPFSIYEFLAQPKIVFFPKLINLVASFLILFMIIRKWLPEETNRIETLNKLLSKRTKEIEAANVILRSEAQIALENEERYRKTTINSPFPIMIHAEDGEVILINKIWTNITGYELDEINTIGKWTEKAYGKKATTIKPYIDKLYTLGQAVEEGEFTITTKSGEQRIWEFSSAPLDFHADGRRMVISTAVDITDKKKTANDLAESNEYNRALFEQTAIGLALTSIDGKLVDVNAAFAAIIGYSIEEMLQLTYWDITPEKYADEERKQLESISQNNRYGPFEKEYIHKDGHLVPVRLQGKLLKREGVDYIWSSVEDITETKKAKLKIIESENQFRSLIEQSGDAMYLSDLEGNIINVNKKACETLGYERDELLKIKITDVDVNYPSMDDQQELWNNLIPGESQTLETQHKRKNGELITVEVVFGHYEFLNKKLILGFARDITERKAANEILQKSKIELKETQRIGRLGSWYLNLDTNEVIWTEELYKMYDFDPTLPAPSYTDFQKIFTAESWNKLSKSISETIKTEIPYELELQTVRKDGSNGWMWASGESVKDVNGVIIGIRGASQDITERKQAEEALLESEKLLNNTQQLTKIGGWKWSIKNQTMFWTIETYRIHEIDPDERNRTPNDFIQLGIQCYDEKDREVINDAFNKCKNDGTAYDFEFPFTTLKGNRIWIRTTAEAEKENGKVIGVIGNIMNITERKQAEDKIKQLNEELEHKVLLRTAELEKKGKDLNDSQKALLNIVEDLNEKSNELEQQATKLEIANKELESFSYSVSHDLRAPLRAINGFSKFLVEDYEELLGEEGKRLIKVIRTNAKQMDQLITDILQLSRLSRNDVRTTNVNMEELVKSVFDEIALPLEKKQFEFIVNKIPASNVDATLIRQVWVNLISNAIKYSIPSDTKKIIINFELNENGITYFIKDFGVGFNPDYKHKLFGIFQRLHHTDEFEGTGVGLAIVQRIIHKHGGEVWAEAKEGKGATFYFSIPIKN